MNIFDLLVIVAFLVSAFMGWRRGFVWQVVQIVVLLAAYYAATFFSQEVGEMLGMKHDVAAVGGFIAIFFVALIAMFVLGYITRTMFHAVGLKGIDGLLGTVLGGAKALLILGIVFSWFMSFNLMNGWVSMEMIESSRFYAPLVNFAQAINPYLEELYQTIMAYKF